MRYPDGSFDSPAWVHRLTGDQARVFDSGWPDCNETVPEVELGTRVFEQLDMMEEVEDVTLWADLAVVAAIERLENPNYCYRLALDTVWWEALSPELRRRMVDRCPPGCSL